MNDQPRNWMTAEEFLAQVEAHRQKRLQEPPTRKPFVPGPFVRTYVLDWSRKFIARPTAPTAAKPEVEP